VWHGERLFEAANEPKESYWVEGAGHNDVSAVAGERYWEVVKEFTGVVRAQRGEKKYIDLSNEEAGI
jgi:hypothetical protein